MRGRRERCGAGPLGLAKGERGGEEESCHLDLLGPERAGMRVDEIHFFLIFYFFVFQIKNLQTNSFKRRK